MAAMSQGEIASYFITLHGRGIEETKEQIASTKRELESLQRTDEDLQRKLKRTADETRAAWESTGARLKRTYADVAGTIGTAFKAASAAVLGLATAGMRGTQEGNRMAFAWQQLSREVGAVFLPAAEKLVEKLKEITLALREMNSEQQDSIANWAGVAAGGFAAFKGAQFAKNHPAGAVAALFAGTLAGGFSAGRLQDEQRRQSAMSKRVGVGEIDKTELDAVRKAAGIKAGDTPEEMQAKAAAHLAQLRQIGQVMKRQNEGGHLSKLFDFFTGGGSGVATISAAGDLNRRQEIARRLAAGEQIEERNLFGPGDPKGKGHRSLTPAVGGFESLTSTYGRIQASINQMDPGLETAKNQLAVQQAIDQKLDHVMAHVGRIMPGL